MYNSEIPPRNELPTSAQLLRSMAIAIVAAGAILVTIVLPSEYGIDPTGVGGALGLTEMGEIKEQLANEAEADKSSSLEPIQPLIHLAEDHGGYKTAVQTVLLAANASNSADEWASYIKISQSSTPTIKNDETTILLKPGEGVEVKLTMNAGDQVNFEWTANGGKLNYDTHGDGGGKSISYEKGRGVASDNGVLKAAFTGNHGWFWRNRTKKDVTMTLRTTGAYAELKRML